LDGGLCWEKQSVARTHDDHESPRRDGGREIRQIEIAVHARNYECEPHRVDNVSFDLRGEGRHPANIHGYLDAGIERRQHEAAIPANGQPHARQPCRMRRTPAIIGIEEREGMEEAFDPAQWSAIEEEYGA
jgi:hypothetical protein